MPPQYEERFVYHINITDDVIETPGGRTGNAVFPEIKYMKRQANNPAKDRLKSQKFCI